MRTADCVFSVWNFGAKGFGALMFVGVEYGFLNFGVLVAKV